MTEEAQELKAEGSFDEWDSASNVAFFLKCHRSVLLVDVVVPVVIAAFFAFVFIPSLPMFKDLALSLVLHYLLLVEGLVLPLLLVNELLRWAVEKGVRERSYLWCAIPSWLIFLFFTFALLLFLFVVATLSYVLAASVPLEEVPDLLGPLGFIGEGLLTLSHMVEGGGDSPKGDTILPGEGGGDSPKGDTTPPPVTIPLPMLLSTLCLFLVGLVNAVASIAIACYTLYLYGELFRNSKDVCFRVRR